MCAARTSDRIILNRSDAGSEANDIKAFKMNEMCFVLLPPSARVAPFEKDAPEIVYFCITSFCPLHHTTMLPTMRINLDPKAEEL